MIIITLIWQNEKLRNGRTKSIEGHGPKANAKICKIPLEGCASFGIYVGK